MSEVLVGPGRPAGRPVGAHLSRLAGLCDPGTADRLAAGPRGCAVAAVRGLVHGRPVHAYAHDDRRAGGAVGPDEADAIVDVHARARAEGTPLVALTASAGARLQQGTRSLDGIARIFAAQVADAGRIPQIAVVAGPTAGGASYGAALADLVVMQADACMFLTGPRVVEAVTGEAVGAGELGGPDVHAGNGVADLVAPGRAATLAVTRRLLGHLPGHEPMGAPPPGTAHETPDGPVPADPRQVYDVREVVERLLDPGSMLELRSRWARNMLTALAHLDGRSVGVIANQPRYLGGIIDAAASRKAAEFAGMCDRLGLPLVVLVDTPGFMPGRRQEAEAIIDRGAEMLRAFGRCRVPTATVVLRKAYGGAFIAMNCKGLGSGLALAWPQAELGVMGARQAVGVLHHRRAAVVTGDQRLLLEAAYAQEHLGADVAAGLGVIDAIVEPCRTRARLCAWVREDEEAVCV